MSKYVGGFNDAPRNVSEERINRRLGESVLGERSVNAIDINGVLEIRPSDGKYITLVDHGAADFEITGFGDKCPVGYEIVVTVPRTIGDTGGVENELGNYVQFMHTASGDGFDLTINKRMDSGSALYTYQAYPNATDAFGNAAALHEQFTFVCVSQSNGGRWKLVKLPEEAVGENINGNYNLKANGKCLITGASSSGDNIFSTPENVHIELPIESNNGRCSIGLRSNNNNHYLGSNLITSVINGDSFSLRNFLISSDGGSVAFAWVNYQIDGYWKPSV